MTEKPILFSARLILAILAGRKTQTRRVVRGGALEWIDEHGFDPAFVADPGNTFSPYGRAGDELWVRESFRLRLDQDDKPPRDDHWKSGAWYEADRSEEPSGCGGGMGKLRPSIFMPRWASRIQLKVTSIRIERLADLSEDDAKAEGAAWRIDEGGDLSGPFEGCGPIGYVAHFRDLWDNINAKRGYGWDANPWVWVVGFERWQAKT